MSYRQGLPQVDGDDLFLTDGGIETTLIYHEGQELPLFAAFVLLKTTEGRDLLHRYFLGYTDIAERLNVGIVLESPTWRAGPAWAPQLGYSPDELAEVNHAGIALLEDVKSSFGGTKPVVLSGCIGPAGDGYVVDGKMTTDQATEYHRTQIETYAQTAADMVGAITMTYVEEAIGVARAAEAASMPCAISFTIETDGRLPSGQPLEAAIQQVDAETDGYPAYYMVNCAHPSHLMPVVTSGGTWTERIGGLRANASRMSHAELDEAEELDDGNPVEFGAENAELMEALPRLIVLGGCCGTDVRHVEQAIAACQDR